MSLANKDIMNEITQEYLEKNLLSDTDALFNHVYWVEHTFDVLPAKKHRKTSINFNDIKERRDDFLQELILTTTDWVYSKQKAKEIVDQRLTLTPNSTSNASAFLTMQALSKFRPGYPQGQFGELILFNFIQHFFKAVPLLRKQPITTSIGHERYGADAIHYKRDGNKHVLILGESKCYESKYSFKKAFEKSLSSIVSSLQKIDSELGLYCYDGFIEEPLLTIAQDFKNGKLKDVHFELVCLIAYNESNKLMGKDEASIKGEILSFVEANCKSIKKALFDPVDEKILDRVHYIFFPVFEMDKLLQEFLKQVGATDA